MTCVVQTIEYGCSSRHLVRRRDEKATRSVGSSCVKKPVYLDLKYPGVVILLAH